MLVLANGAYKSGSTWLSVLVANIMTERSWIPEPYRDPRHLRWLDPVKTRAFLATGLHREQNYFSKAHMGTPRLRRLLLSHEDVYVLNITRDLRDTVTSHYYHFKRDYGPEWDFPTYYWRLGRYKAYQIQRYHEVWSEPSPQLHVTSFEGLKTDFHKEVRGIGAFLGRDLDDAEIEHLREKTSLERMAKSRKQDRKPVEKRHFRKGAIGDWRNHFDERSLRDLEAIGRGRFGLHDRAVYHTLFSLRPPVQRFYGTRLKPLLAGAGRA